MPLPRACLPKSSSSRLRITKSEDWEPVKRTGRLHGRLKSPVLASLRSGSSSCEQRMQQPRKASGLQRHERGNEPPSLSCSVDVQVYR